MSTAPSAGVTVIIPARNEARRIGRTVRTIREHSTDTILEILVVDDGSEDDTARIAEAAGATVVPLTGGGNPAIARNRGARQATGAILLFLDADCLPRPAWLAAHLRAQAEGAEIVGGSLALSPGLGWTARADYYATAYHVHPGRKAGPVPNHTPANLSVQRSIFAATGGYTERFPVADGHEELAWQAEARQAGARIQFEPAAVVEHENRSGLGNLLRRSYRWGYSALESKATSGTSRAPWYRYPALAIILAYPLALAETVYIGGAWLAAGRWEVLPLLPLILLSRLVYATALMVGGVRWLLREPDRPGLRSQWR